MEERKDTQYTKNMFIFSGAQEIHILYALLPSSHPTPPVDTPRERMLAFGQSVFPSRFLSLQAWKKTKDSWKWYLLFAPLNIIFFSWYQHDAISFNFYRSLFLPTFLSFFLKSPPSPGYQEVTSVQANSFLIMELVLLTEK